MALAVRDHLATQIDAALARWDGEPMCWGRDDCALSIANLYVSVFERDPASAFRGRYRSERGARRVLGKRGLPGALARTAHRMGWRRIPVTEARTGDLGMVLTAEGPACVVRHRDGWVGRVDNGFTLLPGGAALRAWNVVRD